MQKLPIFLGLLFLGAALFSCQNEGQSSTGTDAPQITQTINVPRFNRDSAYAFIQEQVDFGPRVPGSEAHQACKDWLVSKLESYGARVKEQDFTADVYTGEQVPGTNIFAQFNPERSRRLLFGAHWDTRPMADSPLSEERQEEPILGADDGGSGVGVLLEVARLIGADTSLDIGVDIVFFDVEDYGQGGGEGWALGSQYWSRNLPYGGNRPEYGVLLDMVGTKGARFAQEAHSLNFAPNLVEKVWRLAGYMGYSNYFVNQRGGQITDDHYYVNTIGKIPMINIINQDPSTGTGFGPHWHTHRDDMEVIDKATIRAVGKLVLELIYREDAGAI